MQQGNQLPEKKMGISDGGIFVARNPARLDNRRGVHLLRQKIRRLKRHPRRATVGHPALNVSR
jgi:hypothetical protein